MLDLSRYAFSALREEGFTLYRGSGDGLDPILLVAPVGEYSPRECLKRLEHEYALRDALDAQWAARPSELTLRNGRMTLVFEDPGGELLDRLLGRRMEVEPFLRIAVPLAAAIGQVHARGLIHKDLKPSNILVDMASGGVWLTGFGIASRLPREHHIAEPPEVIAGTLAYMAPEQTGRMNRSVGEALDDLRRDTCEITDDVHRLSYRLHSSTLDYLGLVPALQKLVTEFGERHNIAITFMHASVPPYLPPEVALCLFRVAEESLTNIAKHSQARSATVQVTGEPDGTHLTVEDAGTGFDMPALGSKVGLGFVSMRERLRVVHGTLQVDSAPSQGTRIDAWVPLTIVTSAHTRHETTPDPAGRRP